ncbi:hypothetical protein ACFLZH_05445, partial [Patescibacteria group bacterium]
LSYLSDTYSKARTDSIPTPELQTLQEQILVAYENAQTKFREPNKASDIPEDNFKAALKIELIKEIQLLEKETITPAIVQEY